MFYPVDSLKRGGRFYLCWVADSWPLRFAHITHRQLWSQDIRKICDDLLEVIKNESGRPTNRFSLRLSSQLLRGVARLHYAKASNLQEELCMINATVMKQANKKWHIHKVKSTVQRVRHTTQVQPLAIQEIIQELPEEQRLEELIQRSGNIVSNIEDITLKEATIKDVLLPPNDGFGEEHPDHALHLLQDRTLEMMLVQPELPSVHSGLAAALDVTVFDKSHERSRLGHELQMESIEGHDVTLFKKSMGAELFAEFEKDNPEIPEIPPPDLPVPQPDKAIEEPVPEPPSNVAETSKQPEPEVEIELEELEEVAPQAKRRRFGNKLIIDKKIKISTNQFRARIENPLVELRCEDSSDDIIFIHVTPDTYFRRPCHGGEKILSNIGFVITRQFIRNLGVVSAPSRLDREMELPREAIIQKSAQTFTRSMLERIDEEQEAPIVQERLGVELEPPRDSVTNVTGELQNIFEPGRVSAENQIDLDIADMLTQKVETLSQARKRTAEQETLGSLKRQRSIGYVSFRESQQAKEKSLYITDVEADKENIPDNIPPQAEDVEILLSSKLQEAGLADIAPQPMFTEVSHSQTQRPSTVLQRKSQRTGSESSETPLGSLDRTKVSLGDSEQTTDSRRFIRDHWGTEGTMVKILKHIKANLHPVTVNSLVTKGPVLSGFKCIIAARCFTSMLKLKHHGFINITKDPETLEITDVSLGPKLTNSN